MRYQRGFYAAARRGCSSAILLFAHDLFEKPASAFAHHAAGDAALQRLI
jgi:hypothetical protein